MPARGRGRGIQIRQNGNKSDSALGTSDGSVAATRSRIGMGRGQRHRIPVTPAESTEVGEATERMELLSHYTHKQPDSGDQGVKPEAEKKWPDMWHGDSNIDGPMTGVSPFSESGRFIITGESKINTHRNKKYKFTSCERVQDVSGQDSHQSIARSLQLQAPPKALPHYIYDDYVDKQRNCNQLLNEFCQFRRKTIAFEDVQAKEGFKNYAMRAVVDTQAFQPGEAWKKQIAKEAASRNALKYLLLDYYKQENDSPKVERLKNMTEMDEKITREQDHPTRYREQPKVSTNQLSIRLLTKSENAISDEESDAVAGEVWKKLHKLKIRSYKHDLVAAVILYRGVYKRDPLVVSMASGRNEVSDGFRKERDQFARAKKWGRVLNDTCALTMARRGLKRYLLIEAERFFAHQYESKFESTSIFKLSPDANQTLVLNEGIDIIFYSSGLPTTRPNYKKSPLTDRPNQFVNRAGDKFARWLVLGLQGSLGARIMEPIYPSGFIIGERPTSRGTLDDVIHFQMYIKHHVSDTMQGHCPFLPGVYHPFRPTIRYIPIDDGFPPQDDDHGKVFNWVYQSDLTKPAKEEMIDLVSGYAVKKTVQNGHVQNGQEPGLRVSRLSKFALFGLYLDTLKTRRLGHEQTDESYRTSKHFAKDYRLTKNMLDQCWAEAGIGYWPKHPENDLINIDQPTDDHDIISAALNRP